MFAVDVIITVKEFSSQPLHFEQLCLLGMSFGLSFNYFNGDGKAPSEDRSWWLHEVENEYTYWYSSQQYEKVTKQLKSLQNPSHIDEISLMLSFRQIHSYNNLNTTYNVLFLLCHTKTGSLLILLYISNMAYFLHNLWQYFWLADINNSWKLLDVMMDRGRWSHDSSTRRGLKTKSRDPWGLQLDFGPWWNP